ncbi:phytanoyl-CoA dioxygenase family protein [Alteromonas sp. ASW11-36]|uniref:Phytanoyl-CoA dioxygenase family protein n=1 Tax=Alteromonas arenosi TaxID=3055817 RepID=A0ABT7SY60_9ALTE|nr:phytanoyl-CoA dioxygenase family protein [Alteromonas sp. ASW11-36]MDM7860944.1 phytanoyl-CoA dioxygenase family protein [Alteromonas sp. ASW11-36]
MITTSTFAESGFVKIPGFLNPKECQRLLKVVHRFHSLWMEENLQYFHQGVINSSNLTKGNVLDDEQRLVLFKLISSDSLVSLVQPLLNTRPRFMGTQLFFDPYDVQQANYWHRDGQYHLDLEQQKQALIDQQVVHCRIALLQEKGIEVIPGTHKRWDTDTELAVRLEQGGRVKSDMLPNSQAVPLDAGDLLIFSANMLHRGLYGNGRYALDILYCDDKPELTAFVQPDSLPSARQSKLLDNPIIFQ